MKLLSGAKLLSLLVTQTLLSLLITQTAAQNVSSDLKPCKLVRLKNQDIFTYSKTNLRLEAKLEEDNRPCTMLVKRPNEENNRTLQLPDKTYGNNCKVNKNKGNCRKQDYAENTTIQVKNLAGKWTVKIYFSRSDEETRFRGKYLISDLTFFAFPKQVSTDEIIPQDVSDLTCPDEILHGQVNLTEDFHMCCEYHRSKAINMSHNIQCCEECIRSDNKTKLEFKINYDKNYLKFTVPAKKEDQINPYTIACVIDGEGSHQFTLKFKASASKATPRCFIDYGNASVGLAVGLGVLFLVCVMVIYFWRKTKIRVKETKGELDKLMKPPDMPEWANPFHYPRGYLSLDKEIGMGSFGVVIKGLAQNLGTSGDNVAGQNNVAVKTYRGGGASLDEFLKEGEIMSKLDFHYNVINLLGVTQDVPEKSHRLLLILDFCSRGSLDNILKEKLTEIQQNPELVETEDFNMKLLAAWTYHIAMGMKFLSNNYIIHGDLAARNILVDGDNTAKIADFGKAHRLKYDNIGVEVKGNQPMWWMSPEALENQTVTMESDKWSYGVTVWEIFSLGEEPYADRMVFEGLLSDLLSGYRMPLPERCPKEIYKQVILTSWDENPEKRPDWSSLIDVLHKMVDSKYLKRYNVIQARKRTNYSELRNAVKDKDNIKHNYE